MAVQIKKKRAYRNECSYGICKNNGIKDPTVSFTPFPKPCPIYHKQLVKTLLRQEIPPAEVHKVTDCTKCSKSLTWIHLCQHTGGKLRDLPDITKYTYICNKHFFSGTGPTIEHPDPLPAAWPAALFSTGIDCNTVRCNAPSVQTQLPTSDPVKNSHSDERNPPHINNHESNVYGNHQESHADQLQVPEHIRIILQDHMYTSNKYFVEDNKPTVQHAATLPVILLPTTMVIGYVAVPSLRSQLQIVDQNQNLDKVTAISSENCTNLSGGPTLDVGSCSDNTETQLTLSLDFLKDPKQCLEEKQIESQKQEIFDLTVTCIQAGWACEIRNNDFVYFSTVKFNGSEKTFVNTQVVVTASFKCTVLLLGQRMTETNEIGKLASRVCSVVTLSELLTKLKDISPCCGIREKRYVTAFRNIQNSTRARFCAQTLAVRSMSCKLITNGSRCSECIKYLGVLRCKIRRGLSCSDEVSKFCNDRYLGVKDLKKKAEAIHKECKKASTINAKLRKKVKQVMTSSYLCKLEDEDSTCEERQTDIWEFRQKFLRAQLKFSKTNSHGYRWDPDIVKWCLSIRNKSYSAYEALRQSGCVILPAQRTLFTYSKQLEKDAGVTQSSLKEITDAPCN